DGFAKRGRDLTCVEHSFGVSIWSDEARCDPVYCKEKPVIKYATEDSLNSCVNVTEVGFWCRFSCKSSYVATGAVVCTPSGKWEMDEAKCVKGLAICLSTQSYSVYVLVVVLSLIYFMT